MFFPRMSFIETCSQVDNSKLRGSENAVAHYHQVGYECQTLPTLSAVVRLDNWCSIDWFSILVFITHTKLIAGVALHAVAISVCQTISRASLIFDYRTPENTMDTTSC